MSGFSWTLPAPPDEELPELSPPAVPIAAGDIALFWLDGQLDMGIEDDDAAADLGLRTAVLLSLFVDRRAEPDDALPNGGEDRRGWWADEFAEVERDRIGSRRWLLERTARRADVPRLLEDCDREALAWMVEDRVATRVDVAVAAVGPMLLEQITIHRPGTEPATFRFAHVWDAEAARAV